MDRMETLKPVDFAEISLEGVEGVLLDLDDTLYRYDPCHSAGLKASFERLRAYFPNLDKEGFDRRYGIARARVHAELHGQAASHSRLLYFQKLLEGLSGKTEWKVSLETEEAYWSAFLMEMELLPEARQFVEECRLLEVPICLVTDLTAAIQMRKVARLALQKDVRYLVSSEEAGAEKPHPYIFKLALEKLGVTAENAIMIGDNPKKDVRGASLLGIRGFLAKR